MQFNLVNDQEQVAQFVRRGVAWRGVAWRGVAWRGVAGCGVRVSRGVPEAFCSTGVLLGCGVLAQGVFGQF